MGPNRGEMIELRIGELSGPAEVLDRSTSVSVHTGADIERLRVSIDAVGEDVDDAITESLSDEGPLLTGPDGKNYRATLKMSSHTEGTNSWYYELDLVEAETEPSPHLVRVDGLEIIPRAYRESESHGALVVEFLATVEGEAQEALELKLTGPRPHYFPVERPGVQDESREMRFGKCLWSRDGERRKHRIVLVEKIYDEDEDADFHGFSEPELGNTMRAVSELQETVDRLLALLEAQGSLGTSTPEDLKSVPIDIRRQRSRQYLEVDDTDDPSWWSE